MTDESVAIVENQAFNANPHSSVKEERQKETNGELNANNLPHRAIRGTALRVAMIDSPTAQYIDSEGNSHPVSEMPVWIKQGLNEAPPEQEPNAPEGKENYVPN